MTTPTGSSPPPSACSPPPTPERPGPGRSIVRRAVTAGILATVTVVVAVVLVALAARSAPDPQAGPPDAGAPDALPERSVEAWCAAREELTALATPDLDDPEVFRAQFEQLAASHLTLGALAPPEIRAETDIVVELWTATIEQIDGRGGWQDPAQAVAVIGELTGAEQQAAIDTVEDFAAERCPGAA